MRKIFLALVPIVSTLLYAISALAAEAAAEAAADTQTGITKFGLSIGAGLGLGITAAAGALGQSKAVASAMEGISRNPEAQAKMFLPLILGLVFIESLVIYMLVMAFFLQGKI